MNSVNDDAISAVREWCNALERPFSYCHTEEYDGEDVIFVSLYDFADFVNWLRENVLGLIYIPGKIRKDGVQFASADLRKAKYYWDEY